MTQPSNSSAKKKQAIILGALGLVLAVVLGSQLVGGKPSPAAQATQTGAQAPARISADSLPNAEPRVASVFQRANVNLDSLVQEIKVVEFEYAKERIDRDPTLPLVGDAMLLRARTAKTSSSQSPDDLLFSAKRMKVTGIIWDEVAPLAVIDDNVVAVGFQFEEAIFVKAIERDRVILGLTGQDVEVVSELKEH
jgi:hypothetical protein